MSLLEIDLNIPDHTKELNRVDDYIDSLRKEIFLIKSTRIMSEETFINLYERITNALYFIGDLSEPLFDLSDKLEEEYFKVYMHSPELCKTLWLEHYSSLHKPYNLFKNRLYKLYEDIDQLYKKVNGKQSPKTF